MAGDAVELGATRATNIGDYEVTPPLVVVRIVLHFGIQQPGLPGCVDANGVCYFRNHRAGAFRDHFGIHARSLHRGMGRREIDRMAHQQDSLERDRFLHVGRINDRDECIRRPAVVWSQ